MIRVVLVDDQNLIRQGIQILLEAEGDIEVVAHANNGQQALDIIAQAQPDVVLMDIRMPVMDGVTATRKLNTQGAEAKVIILTTFDDDEFVFEGLKAGAVGYLLKDINSDEMAEAIRTVASGGALIQPSIQRKVLSEFSRLAETANPNQNLAEPLTDREFEVLEAIADGLSNKEIAERLVITEGTVKNHVSNLLGKLDVRDRTQAVLKAQELRLL